MQKKNTHKNCYAVCVVCALCMGCAHMYMNITLPRLANSNTASECIERIASTFSSFFIHLFFIFHSALLQKLNRWFVLRFFFSFSFLSICLLQTKHFPLLFGQKQMFFFYFLFFAFALYNTCTFYLFIVFHHSATMHVIDVCAFNRKKNMNMTIMY